MKSSLVQPALVIGRVGAAKWPLQHLPSGCPRLHGGYGRGRGGTARCARPHALRATVIHQARLDHRGAPAVVKCMQARRRSTAAGTAGRRLHCVERVSVRNTARHGRREPGPPSLDHRGSPAVVKCMQARRRSTAAGTAGRRLHCVERVSVRSTARHGRRERGRASAGATLQSRQRLHCLYCHCAPGQAELQPAAKVH
jgi:hypothetical protein